MHMDLKLDDRKWLNFVLMVAFALLLVAVVLVLRAILAPDSF